MKFFLVGLMLIASALGHVATNPTMPRQEFASAQFRTSAAGVEAVTQIYVSTFPGPARIGISIERTRRVCDGGSCQETSITSGYTYQNAHPGDIFLAHSLDNASVHATIRFHDQVTNADVAVRVDAVWAATGPAQCDDRDGVSGCDRAATVTGEVTVGATPLVAGQTVPDGLLQWRVLNW